MKEMAVSLVEELNGKRELAYGLRWRRTPMGV